MKNIFQFHTDEPSKLQLQMNGKLHYENGTTIALRSNQFLYIVDAKQTIEDTNWFIDTSYNFAGEVVRLKGELMDGQLLHCYKIILTNDPKLIEDGVQEIPNEFLKWYVNHPTEGVLVQYMQYRKKWFYHLHFESIDTKLHKGEVVDESYPEEFKVLEKAAQNLYPISDINWTNKGKKDAFVKGANWQAERMYSEDEVKKLLIDCKDRFGGSDLDDYIPDDVVINWFKQVKKNNDGKD